MKNKSRQDLFFIKLYNLVGSKIQVNYVQIPYQIRAPTNLVHSLRMTLTLTYAPAYATWTVTDRRRSLAIPATCLPPPEDLSRSSTETSAHGDVGQMSIHELTITSPNVITGHRTPYPPFARLSYGYRSNQ